MATKKDKQTATKALVSSVTNQVTEIQKEITESSKINVISGMPLVKYMYNKFLGRLDPVTYCQTTLRAHLPENKRNLHENQVALIRAICQPKIKQVAGMMSRQSGKCFAKGTPILMADGTTKRVENIKAGELVMTPHNTPATVLQLGRGNEEMYRITPTDIGYNSIVVNKSHILSLYNDTTNEIINISVADYIKSYQELKHLHGYRSVVALQSQHYSVHPYLYGLWLGNHKKEGIVINNERVIKKLNLLATSMNMEVLRVHNVHTLQSNQTKNSWSNLVGNWLQTHECIIPTYLYNDIPCRNSLLAGLIDSCGIVNPKISNTVFLTVDTLHLAHDIVTLTRSLGYKSYFVHNEDKYTIVVYGSFKSIPVADNRNIPLEDLPTQSLLFDFTIESVGMGSYYGFCIDAPDHLFLLGDYTVTHNTETIACASGFLIDNYPQMRVGIFTPRLQQAEISIGRLSTFLQQNEDLLNNGLEKITKDCVVLKNGSSVTAFSASDQSNIEGLTLDVIILDEAQKVTDYTFSERIVPIGGGCIVGNSEVTLSDGSIQTIEELVKEKTARYIPSIDINTGEIVNQEILEYHDTGIQETLQVTLLNGNTICGTYDHPVITLKNGKPEWVRLDELKATSMVAIPKSLPFFGTEHNLYARLLGMLLINGTFTNNKIYYQSCEKEIWEYIASLRLNYYTDKKQFSFSNNKVYKNGYITDIYKIYRDATCFEFLNDKQLPVGWQHFDKDTCKELIGGLFDANGEFENDRITLTFIHRKLLNDIQHLLLKFGIQSHISQLDGSYTLCISDSESIANFKDNIKLFTIKKQNIVNQYTFAFNVSKEAYVFMGISSIKKVGKNHVYDLTVSNTHSFIANNIFVHNTNAKIIQIGTPKTRNHFYDAVEGKAHGNWTLVKRDWTQCPQLWALDAIELPDPATGKLRKYSRFVVEQAMPKVLKQEMFPNNPEVWTDGNLSVEDFRTQYMLEFVDGAGKFLTTTLLNNLFSGDFDWLDEGNMRETYFAGIDFAGSNPEGDATHITVVRLTPEGIKEKVFCKEFTNTSYPSQMQYISQLFGGVQPKFHTVRICADYTGCGAAVIQTLHEEYGLTNIEPVIFNQRDKYLNSGMNMKNIMYAKMLQELENNKFRYVNEDRFLHSSSPNAGKSNISLYKRMQSEWSDLESEATNSLNKKIAAPSGYHDDVCDADVLANFATIIGARRGGSIKAAAARIRY